MNIGHTKHRLTLSLDGTIVAEHTIDRPFNNDDAVRSKALASIMLSGITLSGISATFNAIDECMANYRNSLSLRDQETDCNSDDYGEADT